jgi:cell division protein FtsL
MKVFENWVVKKIFGPKREEAIAARRKLHNDELHNLYLSQNIWAKKLETTRLARYAVHMLQMRIGKRLHGGPKRRCENNIRIGIKTFVVNFMYWIHCSIIGC